MILKLPSSMGSRNDWNCCVCGLLHWIYVVITYYQLTFYCHDDTLFIFLCYIKFVAYVCLLCSLLYRYNEFGVDGGPSAKALKPKFDTFAHRVHSQVGFQIPNIDVSSSLALSLFMYKCSFDNVFRIFLVLYIWLK